MNTKVKLSRPTRGALLILIVLVLAAAVVLSVRLVLFAVSVTPACMPFLAMGSASSMICPPTRS